MSDERKGIIVRFFSFLCGMNPYERLRSDMRKADERFNEQADHNLKELGKLKNKRFDEELERFKQLRRMEKFAAKAQERLDNIRLNEHIKKSTLYGI